MTARPLPVSVVSSTSPSSSTGRPLPEFTWPQIIHRAPKMAATMARYLDQLAVSARPATVVAVDLTLRQFAHCVTATDPTCRSMAGVTRTHFEDYKLGSHADEGSPRLFSRGKSALDGHGHLLGRQVFISDSQSTQSF